MMTPILNSTSKEVDKTRQDSASNLSKEPKDLFEIHRTWEVLYKEFFNSKLKYGEDAMAFYRKLETIYNITKSRHGNRRKS